MASWFMGINRGKLEQPGLVTTATTTAGTDFELRVDSGKSSTKEDVIKALRVFEQYILSDGVQSGSKGTNLPPLGGDIAVLLET